MKRVLAALALIPALLCAACGPHGRSGQGEQLWFIAASGSPGSACLQCEARDLGETDLPEQALLLALFSGPTAEGLISPFPEGLALRSVRVEDAVAYVDLSETYNGLSGADMTLADACLVLTLTQLDRVEQVCLTVEGEPRPFRESILSAEDFVLDNVPASSLP